MRQKNTSERFWSFDLRYARHTIRFCSDTGYISHLNTHEIHFTILVHICPYF